ncbi:MAG: hypothetical protein MUC36_27880 [Planctomycetes bacterium]|jgi:hypothetical protein|nr:hypothetical protein [Planctomycetota bacterium]
MTHRVLACVFAFACTLLPSRQDPAAPAQPQDPAPKPAAAKQIAADPADVASVDAIVKALYDVISGPAGQARNWNRLRSLCHPTAKLLPIVKTPQGSRLVPLALDDYIQRSGPMLEQQGFFEQEIARRTETFGDFAHVWSTYAGRHALADAEPFLRGINSIQLVHQDRRWWVLHVLWQQEADAGPIPAEYLPAK